jgi:hypothetical protein
MNLKSEKYGNTEIKFTNPLANYYWYRRLLAKRSAA